MITRRSSVGLGFAAAALFGLSAPAEAQRVSADIYVSGSPVSGVIRIGDHPRPRHIVERHIVLEPRHGWGPRHYRDAKVVVVYYDRGRNVYHERHRKGFDRVRVFKLGDRYYRYDDYDRRDRRDHRSKYDRHDRRDGRDWDDRRDRDRDRDRDDRRGRGRRS